MHPCLSNLCSALASHEWLNLAADGKTPTPIGACFPAVSADASAAVNSKPFSWSRPRSATYSSVDARLRVDEVLALFGNLVEGGDGVVGEEAVVAPLETAHEFEDGVVVIDDDVAVARGRLRGGIEVGVVGLRVEAGGGESAREESQEEPKIRVREGEPRVVLREAAQGVALARVRLSRKPARASLARSRDAAPVASPRGVARAKASSATRVQRVRVGHRRQGRDAEQSRARGQVARRKKRLPATIHERGDHVRPRTILRRRHGTEPPGARTRVTNP